MSEDAATSGEEAVAPEARTRASGRERALATLDRALVLFAAGSAFLAAIRLVPFQTPFPLSALEAEAGWAAPVAAAGLALSIARRSPRTGAAFALASCVLWPWWLGWVPTALGRDASRTTDVRVLSTNVLAPNPSVPLAREILAIDADIVLVQEASTEWWQLLEREGVLARYPHHVEDTRSFRVDYMGIAILSKWPLVRSGIERLGGTDVPFAWADIASPHGTVRAYCIHTWPPVGGEMLGLNVDQFAHVRWLARRDRDEPGLAAVIIGGDFNASPTSRQYRVFLEDTGLVAAHERVGRGLATTWPNLPVPIPPMRLDHVFVAGPDLEVVRVREGEGEGSDHRPVLVELSISAR